MVTEFWNTSTNTLIKIAQFLTCTSTFVIYVLECPCKLRIMDAGISADAGLTQDSRRYVDSWNVIRIVLQQEDKTCDAVRVRSREAGIQLQEGKSTPPAEQTEHLFTDDEEDIHTFDPDALQQLKDTLGTLPPGAGHPSCIVETPPPAQATQLEAPTTTAVSHDPPKQHMAFQRCVLGRREKMADQVRVGFNLMATKLDAICGYPSPISDHSQSLTDTHSPLHALQRSMADIAGVLTLRQEQLSSQSGYSDVSREVGYMRRIKENMEWTQAERMAVTAAHQREVAGFFHALQTLIMALLPQGLARITAAATTPFTSPPPEVSMTHSAAENPPRSTDVSLPHSDADKTTPPTCGAHETSEDEDADDFTLMVRRTW
ncbi:uncharacterized protein LOC144790759 [Lissotriton helveticus]